MKKQTGLILFFLSLFFLSTCSPRKQEFQSFNIFIMDTYVNIKLPDTASQSILTKEVKSFIKEEQKFVDRHFPGSALSRLNRDGTIQTEGNSLVDLIEKSKLLNEKTTGLFSITLAPILVHWENPGKEFSELPYGPETFRYLSKPHSDTIEITEGEGYEISLSPGVELDLGAIAKGYIVDKLSNFLIREKGFEFGLINAGGDILVWGGAQKDSGQWSIGIQDPRGELGRYDYIVQLKNGAVTTSGDYERGIVVNGEFYHHIINPETMLSSNYAHSVTVIVEKPVFLKESHPFFLATEADALSTAIMCMKKNRARAFCEEFGIMAIIYEEDYHCYISPALENSKIIKINRSGNGK